MKSINYILLLTCVTSLLTLTIACEKDEVANGDLNNFSLSSVQADLYLKNLPKEKRDTGFVNFAKRFHMTKKIEEETRRSTTKKTSTKAAAKDMGYAYNDCENVTDEQLAEYEISASEVTLSHEGYVGSKTEIVAWQVVKNYFGFWEVTSNETVTLKPDENHNWNITNITHDGSYLVSWLHCPLFVSWEEAGHSFYPDYNYNDGGEHKTQTALVRVFGNIHRLGSNTAVNNYVAISLRN